jgi:HD superfamily phosphohydrolase
MMNPHEQVEIPAELGVNDAVQIISDRIYNRIPITRLAYELLLTPELQRLNGVSHLGLLNGMTRLNVCASRLEHALGVYLLVLIVTRLPELRPYRNLLIAAALGHDMGSPPYSHSVEGVQKRVMRANHETVLAQSYFRSSVFAQVLGKWDISYDEFCLLVQGKHPNGLLNALIHGHHDLDRCDGTCRYALTWHPVRRGLPYDPEEIAYSFSFDESGHLVLRERADCRKPLANVMDDFIDTRQAIFDVITSPIIEAPEVQLARGVTFAEREGKITSKFFYMEDKEATTFLLKRCNGRTKALVDRVMNDQHYERVYAKRFFRPDPAQVELLESDDKRQEFADKLAEALGIPPEDVCVNSGKFKGIVNMRGLAILASDGKPLDLPTSEPYWFAHAYLHPHRIGQQERLTEIMDELFGITLQGSSPDP